MLDYVKAVYSDGELVDIKDGSIIFLLDDRIMVRSYGFRDWLLDKFTNLTFDCSSGQYDMQSFVEHYTAVKSLATPSVPVFSEILVEIFNCVMERSQSSFSNQLHQLTGKLGQLNKDSKGVVTLIGYCTDSDALLFRTKEPEVLMQKILKWQMLNKGR